MVTSTRLTDCMPGMLADGAHHVFHRAIAELDERVLDFGAALLRHVAGLGQLVRTENLFFEKNFGEIAAPFGHGIVLPAERTMSSIQLTRPWMDVQEA